MKFPLITFLSLISAMIASAQAFPDIKLAFKNFRLISVTEIDPFNKIMSFASDDSFPDFKTQLLEKLGQVWIESPEKEIAKSKMNDVELKLPGPPNLDLRGKHHSHQPQLS